VRRLRLIAAALLALALAPPAGAGAMTAATRSAISHARQIFPLQHHVRPGRRLHPEAVSRPARRGLRRAATSSASTR
jgi:hypothetical protein